MATESEPVSVLDVAAFVLVLLLFFALLDAEVFHQLTGPAQWALFGLALAGLAGVVVAHGVRSHGE